jgi:peptidoglycan/xylan/chitin deacetylase (PgdA/CDA1 family)
MGKSINRRRLGLGCAVACLVGLAVTVLLWVVVPEWAVDRLARLRPGCLYRVRTGDSVVALTIDDGPNSLATPVILSELRKEQARATFFLIADEIAGKERLVRRLLAEGHEIGNHFSQDRASIRLSPADFEADLLRSDSVLRQFGGVRWARPGSGWYSNSMVATMRRHGYRCALGSVYPFDVAIPSVGFAARYIIRSSKPGAILVLHDGNERGLRTARVLQHVLPGLRQRGFRIVTLSELAEGS